MPAEPKAMPRAGDFNGRAAFHLGISLCERFDQLDILLRDRVTVTTQKRVAPGEPAQQQNASEQDAYKHGGLHLGAGFSQSDIALELGRSQMSDLQIFSLQNRIPRRAEQNWLRQQANAPRRQGA
ncbi:MAG: hypothetical protein WDM89_10875 [Rhizomicrobium sp.]